MPSFGLAHPRGRFPFERLTAAALARIARFPSYRAPRAADLHDPTTFQPPAGPSDEPVMSGRAFLAFGSSRPDVRLVAVQPFVGELAGSPHLATLRRLDLTGNRIGPAGARALAGSPHLGGLRELGLNGNAISSDGTGALAKAPWLAAVERLEVADNGLTADDVGRLLDVTPRVTAVDASGNEADVAGLLRAGVREVVAVRTTARRADRRQAAGESGESDHVRRCGTCVTHPPPDGGRLAELESLDLRHTHFPLHEHGAYPALAHLHLGFTDCGDAFDSASFPALRTLNMRACRLVRPVLRSATLETLDLSVNPLADHAVAVAGCPSLTHLNLANTGLTDAGLLRVLAAVPRLRSLNLAWNPLKAAAVAAIVAQLGFTGRLSIDLTGVIPARSPLPP